MIKEEFDLKKCFACADDTFENKFGRVPDFNSIESLCSSIKNTEKALSYKILEGLTDKRHWNFKDYWIIPDQSDLEKDLKKTRGIFLNLPKNEKNTIEVLYKIFKNIEVVSIVMRFIDSENYGIISPPVRYALKLFPKKNYVEEYLDYLSSLRNFAEEYKFDKVADADIALWSLVEKCVIPKDSSCENYKRYKDKIIKIEEKRLRAKKYYQENERKLLEIYSQKEDATLEEAGEIKKERDRCKREYDELRRYGNAMFDLIDLQKSSLSPEEKFIYNHKEPFIDEGQKYFMNALAESKYINKVRWFDNCTSKPPSKISNIQECGEVTIIYVGKDNYSAKIKVYPVDCPDFTHAKYFAMKVSETINIPNLYKEKG